MMLKYCTDFSTSWQVNFKNIVPEEYLNQMSVHKITKGVKKSLEVNNLFVYENDDMIVAFVGCGSNRLQEHPEYESRITRYSCSS